MRTVLCLMVLLLVAGCGSSKAATPTATPKPTPIREPGAKFSQAPPMTINTTHKYSADISTNRGTFTIELLPKLAPVTVNSFVFLAKHNFFNNNPFHRIIQNFVIQSGDPTGTGAGGPGYQFKDEIHKNLRYTPGTVAMANSGPGTNGSQFFIVVGTGALTMSPNYTIFGRVTSGMNVVQNIANTPVTTNPGSGEVSMPLVRVYVKSVTIHDSL